MKVSAGPDLNIQMVDLVNQYHGIADEVRERFDRILETGAFIGGKEVGEFEQNLKEYLNIAHVIPCANGTDALQLALMALNLEKGDEVIVPAFTFIASVEVIALLGYTPVACDVDADTFNLNVHQLGDLITLKTQAILPVHLFGQCCNMDAIMAVAKQHNLHVIEDNAQSIGAHYTFQNGETKAAGAIGHIGTTSFYPSKNLGCYGDGGAVFTNDPELGAYLRSIANHGMTRRYYHDHIGINSRLDGFQAAVLNVKFGHIDKFNKNRLAAADKYDELLSAVPEVVTPARVENSTHVFHQYTIRVPARSRDKLQESLKEAGVPSMIYYPVPIQEQKAFAGRIKTPVSLDVTNELCRTVLSLPIHSELTLEQVAYICDQISQFFKS